MSNTIPKLLYKNDISQCLNDIRRGYGVLTRHGVIYGLIAIDQDAKIIAVDERFDRKLNYWDLSSIGAALYGVSRQGQDFFDANSLERATVIYDNMKLIVKSIGDVHLDEKGKREILIVLLTAKEVNLGVILLQLKKNADKMRKLIKDSGSIKETLKMNEREFKKQVNDLKKSIFGSSLVATED